MAQAVGGVDRGPLITARRAKRPPASLPAAFCLWWLGWYTSEYLRTDLEQGVTGARLLFAGSAREAVGGMLYCPVLPVSADALFIGARLNLLIYPIHFTPPGPGLASLTFFWCPHMVHQYFCQGLGGFPRRTRPILVMGRPQWTGRTSVSVVIQHLPFPAGIVESL